MEWTVLGTLVGIATFGYMCLLGLREDMNKRLDRIENILRHHGEILHLHGERLARIEGAFQERGYWESRKTGTEIKG